MQPARPYRVLPAAPALLGALRKEIFRETHRQGQLQFVRRPFSGLPFGGGCCQVESRSQPLRLPERGHLGSNAEEP